MNPERNLPEVTRAALKEWANSVFGEKTPTKEELILDQISARLTVNARNEADAMRIELYLMDIMEAVVVGTDQDDDALIKQVKEGDSFQSLNTVMDVPDSTTLGLIQEIKEKLTEPQS